MTTLNITKLEPWQKRVILEQEDLSERLNKLTDALATREWSPKVRDQLMRQFAAMSAYEAVLSERIADF